MPGLNVYIDNEIVAGNCKSDWDTLAVPATIPITLFN